MKERLADFLSTGVFPEGIVPGYLPMLAFSIAVGSYLILWLWERSGENVAIAYWLIGLALPSLFVGARIFFLLQYGFPEERIEWFTGSGIALYGGFFGIVVPWLIVYLIRPYRIFHFLDCVAPGLALGLIFTRIGCFLEGCNAGIVSDLPWAARFPAQTDAFYQQVEEGLIAGSEALSLPVHPTQLYESLFGLGMLVFLLLWVPRRHYEGQVFILGMAAYAACRFLLEFIRSDAGGLHPLGFLTFSQFISILIAVTLLALAWFLRSRHEIHFDPVEPPPSPS